MNTDTDPEVGNQVERFPTRYQYLEWLSEKMDEDFENVSDGYYD